MRKCPKCYREIADDTKFCSFCGANVKESQKKVCSNCGKELNPNARFCDDCGTKISSYNTNINKIKSTKKHWLLTALLFLYTIFTYLFYNYSEYPAYALFVSVVGVIAVVVLSWKKLIVIEKLSKSVLLFPVFALLVNNSYIMPILTNTFAAYGFFIIAAGEIVFLWSFLILYLICLSGTVKITHKFNWIVFVLLIGTSIINVMLHREIISLFVCESEVFAIVDNMFVIYMLFAFVYRMIFYVSIVKLGTKQIKTIHMIVFSIVSCLSCVVLYFVFLNIFDLRFQSVVSFAIGQTVALPIILLNSKRKETNLKEID